MKAEFRLKTLKNVLLWALECKENRKSLLWWKNQNIFGESRIWKKQVFTRKF